MTCKTDVGVMRTRKERRLIEGDQGTLYVILKWMDAWVQSCDEIIQVERV